MQQFCAALVPSAIGKYPGRQSALVLGIEICSGGRQKFDSLQVAMESGEMQRSDESFFFVLVWFMILKCLDNNDPTRPRGRPRVRPLKESKEQ